MSASIRRQQKREDVREMILAAAKRLFVTEGYHATSIRRIASAVNLSPTTIYLYYADKNDIMYALSQEGFGILGIHLSSLMNVEEPFERLKALGRTYLRFAREHPDYYEVMFMLKEPMEFLDSKTGEACWREGMQTFGLLTKTVCECCEAGYFRGEKPENIALQAWAVVHGLTSLYLTSRIQKITEENLEADDPDALVESAFKTYINFLEQTKS